MLRIRSNCSEKGATRCCAFLFVLICASRQIRQATLVNVGSNDLITGERVIGLCDVAYFSESYVAQFPTFRRYIKSMVTTELVYSAPETVRNTIRGSFIFCTKLDWIEEFKRDIVPLIHSNFILVTHNSDHLAGQDTDLLNEPFLIRWYGQNMLPHTKTKGVPIGLENADAWGRTDFRHIWKCRKNRKTNVLYFQFSDYSNSERPVIRKTLRQNGFHENKPKSWQHYISELSSYKFCAAPPGNGIDTHRAWECIYLGVVPIIVRSSVMQAWFQNANIMWVDSYEEVTLQRLRSFKLPKDMDLPAISRLSYLQNELEYERSLTKG